VDEIFDDPGAGQLLQVAARLAELDAQTLDVADAETLADQVVEPDVTHHDLPPGLGAGQADVLERFGLDEGQRLAGAGPVGEEIAVALQALPRDRADGADRAQRLAGPMLMASTYIPSIIASVRGLANRVNDRAGPGLGE
jgi:hypothetical protein